MILLIVEIGRWSLLDCLSVKAFFDHSLAIQLKSPSSHSSNQHTQLLDKLSLREDNYPWCKT